MPLLEVRDLAVYYPLKKGLFGRKQFLKAVDGVSFHIDRGEIVGLVGESGCGKSTIGKALVKLEEPTRGEIILDGVDLATVKGKKLRLLRRKFQMIFQDPYGSLNPRMTVFDALDEVISLHLELSREERYAKAVELLELVGMPPEALNRYPHQFSGGQRQRIGIARALALEPELVVADEPVSALDVSVQASIVNLLSDIQKQKGTAFLFVAHDLAVVEHISHRILVMYLGHIVESGPAKELIASPLHPYTRALLDAVPVISREKKPFAASDNIDAVSQITPPDGCPFAPRCPHTMPRCFNEKPQLLSIGGTGRQCACFLQEH